MANTTRKCVICGERHDCVDITTHDDCTYTVCEKCASTYFKRSCVSGKWVLYDQYIASIEGVDDLYDVQKWKSRLNCLGLFMLEEEWRNANRFCDVCKLPSLGLAEVSDKGELLRVCDDCFDELYSAYEQCAECGTYFDPEYDNGERDRNGDYICNSCVDEYYIYCEDCGDLYRRGSDSIYYSERRGAWVCDHCWDSDYDDYESDEYESAYIHEYSYKPKGVFHDTDADEDGRTLYFGVENEMSHEDSGVQNDHSKYIYVKYDLHDTEGHFYQKSDSSLEYGIEIVSHPMSLSYWHSIYDHMAAVFRGSRDYTEGEDDGLHVHISRAGMTMTHEKCFAAFAQFCRRGIETVARRRNSSYARFIPADDMNRVYRDHDRSYFSDLLRDRRNERYSVVNWQNNRTVEVRAFNSTLDPVEFYACIEFCHATYQFTKIHEPDEIWQMGSAKVLWDVFLNYCADDKRYSHMFDVLYRRAPEMLGSNCEDDEVLTNWWLTPFDRLDLFLERDANLVSGSMVALTCLAYNSNQRRYYDTDCYEDVPQPGSVYAQQMHREVIGSMWRDTYMVEWDPCARYNNRVRSTYEVA